MSRLKLHQNVDDVPLICYGKVTVLHYNVDDLICPLIVKQQSFIKSMWLIKATVLHHNVYDVPLSLVQLL